MGEIFSWKILQKCGGEAIVRPFFLKNWAYLGIKFVELCKVFFIAYQIKGYQTMLKLSCKSLAFTSNKALLKYKIRSEICLPVSFSAQLLKKKILLLLLFLLSTVTV